MPTTVKAVRVLMVMVAVVTAMTTAGFLVASGLTAVTLGYALWSAWPGAVSLGLALRVRDGGVWLLRGIIALQAVYVLLSLARLGAGDPRGLVNLAFPIAILVLATRKSAHDHFRAAGAAFAY